jgi:hypothetical protein
VEEEEGCQKRIEMTQISKLKIDDFDKQMPAKKNERTNERMNEQRENSELNESINTSQRIVATRLFNSQLSSAQLRKKTNERTIDTIKKKRTTTTTTKESGDPSWFL